MKLLFINSFYRPHVGGGAELILETIVEGLAARGHQVIVLATQKSPGLSIETVGSAKVYRAEIQNFYWPYKRDLPPKPVRALWHLRDRNNSMMGKVVEAVIKAESPDTVNFHNLAGFSVAAWDAAHRLGIPSIQTLHDLYLMCPPTTAFKNGKACVTRCAECVFLRHGHVAASRQLAAVVGVSHYILDRLVKEGYFETVRRRVIHNARNIPDTAPPSPRARDHGLTFGYIGSLTPAKGLEWLIAQFKRRGWGSKLLIAGDGSRRYTNRLKTLAQGHDIEFLGYVNSELFYPRIDIAVVPSIWPDSLPGVAYESGAYHVPVIASRTGGLPEIVQDGINGLFCDPSNETTLGDAIDKLQYDRELLAKMSKSARASMEKFFDPSRMIDAYENLMHEIVSTGPAQIS